MNTLTRIVISRLFVAFLLTTPVPAIAQSSALSDGEEVRIRWRIPYDHSYGLPLQRFTVGKVVDQTSTHIMVERRGRFMTVPIASVSSVERRIGTKPATAPAMVMGSGIGFAAGFAAGAILSSLDRSSQDGDAVDKGLSTGVLLGAPLGALFVYAASRSRGIYEPVDMAGLRPTLAVDPSGRVGVRVRIGSR
jgi:hypothetical protein